MFLNSFQIRSFDGLHVVEWTDSVFDRKPHRLQQPSLRARIRNLQVANIDVADEHAALAELVRIEGERLTY